MSKEQKIPGQLDIRRVRTGEFITNVGPTLTIDSRESNVRDYLTDLLNHRYRAVYRPPEDQNYAAFDQFGIASPIVRVDMPLITGNVDGDRIFEIEARPAGIATIASLFPEIGDEIRNYVRRLSEQLGKKIAVKAFAYQQAAKTDPTFEKRQLADVLDVEFFDRYGVPNDVDDYLFLAYGNKGDRRDLEFFEERSLFPVRADGDKQYLIDLGIAQPASLEVISKKLSLGAPFVLKKAQGMWAQDVVIYLGEQRRQVEGSSTTEEVREFLKTGVYGDYLIQPFLRPGVVNLDGVDQFAMARIFALFNPETDRYEIIDSIYMARKNLKLHGTSDAVTGALKFSK